MLTHTLSQCHDYLNGVVAGSLCEPLCVRKEVEFVKCLGHGVKLHVLLAQWAANTVVLKTAKPLGSERAMSHLERPDKFTRKITKQEFIHEVGESLTPQKSPLHPPPPSPPSL